MDVINYASSFIPNRAADDHILYKNIKSFRSNFSLQYEYAKESNYQTRLGIYNTFPYPKIDKLRGIIGKYDYRIETLKHTYITLDNGDIHDLARGLKLHAYKMKSKRRAKVLISPGYHYGPSNINMAGEIHRYNHLVDRGYIHKYDGVLIYYHLPEPQYIEDEYNQEHLDYLKNHGVTMASIAEEQYYLYTLAVQLPDNIKPILTQRDRIKYVKLHKDHITVSIDRMYIDFPTTSNIPFKALVANLYHGNRYHDYLNIVDPTKSCKTYRLQDI